MFFARIQLTKKLTVDPPSAGAGERATKLRSQQEVCDYCDCLLNDSLLRSLLSAPRPCLYLMSSGDQRSSADPAECHNFLRGLACEERQAHDSRLVHLIRKRFLRTHLVCSSGSDIVDYVEPLMLIVGSRGVSQLKGYAHPSF